MKKSLKIILIIISIIILCFITDLICVFMIERPIFAIKDENNVYKSIIYDTYICDEYTVPQIKLKGTKFSCSNVKVDISKVIEIVDTTKDIEDFACAEVLEQFYEDEIYRYYYSCIKSEYIIVKYENGYEQTVANALKYGTINIDDLDLYNIKYIKEEK